VTTAGGQNRNLVLAAMIFAVAMTFIDQTIVSIAVPNIQRELALSSSGVQWVVNGFGHRRMCVLGVFIFTAASVLCGLTPKGGAGVALMFLAALAIVARIAIGIGLSIFGLQQSALWGWGNAGTWAWRQEASSPDEAVAVAE
jgi:MFS family permease